MPCKKKMRRIPVIAYLLLNEQHIINYVRKSTYARYKPYVCYKDLCQETYMAYYTVRPSSPIEHNHQDIKKMFSAVSRHCRQESKSYQMSCQSPSLECFHDESSFYNERQIDTSGLIPCEKRVFWFMWNGYDVFSILMETGMRFQDFQKMKKRIIQKVQRYHQNERPKIQQVPDESWFPTLSETQNVVDTTRINPSQIS